MIKSARKIKKTKNSPQASNLQSTTFTPRKTITYFFNFLLFSTPLYFRFVNEELFEFNKMILVYALTTIIVFFWLVRMVQEQKFIFKKTPLDIPIFLFFISQVISTIFSIHPRTSLLGYYSRFNGGLLSTFTYISLYYAFVSNIRKKDLPGILISTFTSGILVSLYGIFEHFGHSVSCLFAPGLKDFSASCWKQDVQSRVFTTFGQPNWLAAYAITILPLGFVLATVKKYAHNQKLFFATATTLLFTVLLFTRSRSGLLGLAGGTVVFAVGALLVFFRKKKTANTTADFKLATLLLTTIIVVAGMFGTVFTPSAKEIIENYSQKQNLGLPKNQNKTESTPQPPLPTTPVPVANRLETGGTDSGEIRKIVWEGGLRVWRRYPIIGSGVETFAYSYYLDRPVEHNNVSEWDFLYNKAHNELINLLATSGIFGLVTYLSIFITFGVLILKIVLSNKPKNSEGTKLISGSILAGISGLFISNFFGFSTVMVNVLMFVLFGIFVVVNRKADIGQKSKKINSLDQYFAITMLAIFTLVTLVKIYNYWDADRLFAQGKAHFASGNYLVGIQKQIEATEKSPKEALFYDSISNNYAKLAVELAKTGQTTASAQIVNEAIKSSDLAIKYNNRHLNFYKTRSRVFVTLAQLDEKFLADAQEALSIAIKLSPTDPKIIYTQAIIEISLGNIEYGRELLEKAVKLKPDYERAVVKLEELMNPEF